MSSQAESIVPVGPRLSDTDIQDMLAKSVRLYAERAAEREDGLPAFASDAATATEVMVFAIETYCPATDGFSAARIEEEVVVTDKGCRLISLFPAEELPISAKY